MKIRLFIMVNGIIKLIKGMAEVFKLGLMDQNMLDIGKLIKLILEED